MAKKLFLTLAIIAFFSSCGTRRSVVQDPATFDEGVVINDIRWATRNVAAPGTFAGNATDAGGLFTFYEAQNACPPGWRLPTPEEFQSLVDAGCEWTEWTARNVVNSRTFGTAPNQFFTYVTNPTYVNGRTFGKAPNYIFLPAAGARAEDDEVGLVLVGVVGTYWSNTPSGTSGARNLNFDFVNTSSHVLTSNSRLRGFSVRCVAE